MNFQPDDDPKEYDGELNDSQWCKDLCPTCNGSGEGFFSGSVCRDCEGTGEVS